MTDHAELLRAVEEAAKKASPNTIAARCPQCGPAVRERAEQARAEFIVLACNLPFRAVREIVEAAEEALDYLRSGDPVAAQLALDAVLCPDPAGGEG